MRNSYGTSVAKYSTRFWYPENLGGEGGLKYLKLNNSINNVQARACCNWGKIITADAVGIVVGAANSVIASGGASAIPNPALGGIPTAGVVGLITGAGASIGSAIGQS